MKEISFTLKYQLSKYTAILAREFRLLSVVKVQYAKNSVPNFQIYRIGHQVHLESKSFNRQSFIMSQYLQRDSKDMSDTKHGNSAIES